MSDSPVLSYKKPSTSSSKQTSANPSHSSSPLPQGGQSASSTTRQVLSRRKALQDFYKIHQQDLQDDNKEDNLEKQSLRNTIEKPTGINFNDSDELSEFMKTTSIEDILKLRNSITNKFNSHDLAKKSIIYDNYYELIKLSQILGDVSKPKSVTRDTALEGLGIFSSQSPENQTKTKEIKDNDLDNVFKDLSDFISGEVQEFNTDFESLVNNLQSKFSTLDDKSISSVEGIPDKPEIIKFPESIDKKQLLVEINLLLDKDILNLNQESRNQIFNSIQDLLKILNVHHDELLILQLNKLKSKFK